MACLEESPMATDENAAGDRAGGHREDPLGPGDMDLSGEVPKARKPYTITKQREKWTEDEHKRFLEALQLHGRAWRRIQEHIGTKTAVQIRSHAQKFFTKVVRESSSGGNSAAGAAPAIQIPPPRPKRKPAHPYPRKVDGAVGRKLAPALRQLEKPPVRTPTSADRDDGSPTSVLTAARTVLRADALGSVFANSSSGSRSPGPSAAGSDENGGGGGGVSPASSSFDRADSCVLPSVSTAELANCTKAFRDAKEVSCSTGSEAPVFKLFGKKVVVTDHHELLQNVRGLSTEEDGSPSSVAKAAARAAIPFGAAEASSWTPWRSSMQHQVVYLVPQPDGFAAQSVVPWLGYNGSLPCALFYPQAAAASNQQQQRPQPPLEPLDRKGTQREGSLTGSNTASSSAVPAASAAAAQRQNSDAAESRGPGQDNATRESGTAPAAVPRLAKCASSASFSRRGFVPYKRCAAESEAPPVEDADGDLTRLCL